MITETMMEETKQARVRTSRKAKDQAAGPAPARVAKSKDSSKTKVTFYLDSQVAAKLGVSAIIRRVDQSDIANEVLAKALSAVTYYDRSTRPTDSSLPVSEFGNDQAA